MEKSECQILNLEDIVKFVNMNGKIVLLGSLHIVFLCKLLAK